jgi:S-formylglutathione hydrolase FrmB
VLAACGGAQPELHPTRGLIGAGAVEARHAQPLAPPAPAVEGTITVKDGATPRGRIVVGWRSAEDQRELEAGHFSLARVRRLLDSFVPGDEVDFAKTKTAHYRAAGAPPDATPVVMLDVDHTFWLSFSGRGKSWSATAKPGGGDVVLESKSASPPKEGCTGPRRKLLTIDAPELEPKGPRRFCAWLPKDWSPSSSKRYPLVLVFPGFMSDHASYFPDDGDIGVRFDTIAEETKHDAVLVGVDTSTPLGSTYLEDSRGHGAWSTFLAKRVLPVLEKELHLIPKRTARATCGHSTGGYNALSWGMRHSDMFAAIGASSPDPPDFETWLFEPGTRRAKPWVQHLVMLEDALGGAGQVSSWAADFAPDGSARGFAWPIDPQTGTANDAVLARWIPKTPHGLVHDEATLARVRRDLSGRILITVGKQDEFDLFAPAEHFANELNALGVATQFVPNDGGHGSYREYIAAALRFVLERIDKPI